MRTSNSIKNSLTSLFGNFLSFIIVFISQAIFIRLLGAEYLGLNGLFTNILSMLSIFELGIGNAIVFNLYQPIAENNERKIVALINFYKKTYHIIAVLIFCFGIFLLPFINYFVGEISIDINIHLVYFLFLLSTISSYFMVYKRNLIIANQKSYIINLFHVGYLILLNILQLLILFFTKNYYFYLIIKIICQLLENFLITLYAVKSFSFLNKYKNEKISKSVEKDIFKRVKALIFHKIGGIIVLGTDNLIISRFFGVLSVGLYNNYCIITNGITTIFSQIISSTTAAVGNLLVSSSTSKKYEVFKKIRFLNSWISIFTSVSFLVIVQPFISLWVGREYLLDYFVVVVIAFNYFQKMQRQTYSTFKDSAGIWIEDRFIPLIESFLNIIFSLLLLKIFGLSGVFMGTIISGLVLWCYSYPKFVYKKLFCRSYLDYFKETFGYISLFIIISFVSIYISNIFIFNNLFIKLLFNILISILVPNLLLLIIFYKSDEFKYFLRIFSKFFLKFKIKDVQK